MNKKGFTLVEMLAVIVILGIVMTLAITGFISVREDITNSQYENLITRIKTVAGNYAFDYGLENGKYFTVQELIDFGYISPDNDNGDLLNPKDNNQKVNCSIYKVTFKDGEYVIELTEEKLVGLDETCDEITNDLNDIAILCNNTNCKNSWYNEDVEITAKLNVDLENFNNAKIEWTNNLGLSETIENVNSSEDTLFNVTIGSDEVLEALFSITITNNLNDGSTVTYKQTQNIKIDKELPKIISKNIISSANVLEITSSDRGSGVLGHSLINTNETCNTAIYSDTAIKLNNAGDYKICISDNAGNIYSELFNVGKVSFDYNGLHGVTNNYVIYDENNNSVKIPIYDRNGYTFEGWFDQNNKKIESNKDLSGEQTLTVSWNFNDVPLNINKINPITFHPVGASHIIFVIDTSGSMDDTLYKDANGNNVSRMSNLKSSMNSLMSNTKFPEGSAFSVITFAYSPSTKLNKSVNPSDVTSVINSLEASGGTDYHEALNRANDLILDSPDYAKEDTYVIFLSDGEPVYEFQPIGSTCYTGWAWDRDDKLKCMADYLRNNLNIIYTIGFGSGANNTMLNYIASSNGSGKHYYLTDDGATALIEAFNEISENIIDLSKTNSLDGYVNIDDRLVNHDFPFTITANGREYIYSEESDIEKFIESSNGYLSLKKIDEFYKLNGNFDELYLTYYYNE